MEPGKSSLRCYLILNTVLNLTKVTESDRGQMYNMEENETQHQERKYAGRHVNMQLSVAF